MFLVNLKIDIVAPCTQHMLCFLSLVFHSTIDYVLRFQVDHVSDNDDHEAIKTKCLVFSTEAKKFHALFCNQCNHEGSELLTKF